MCVFDASQMPHTHTRSNNSSKIQLDIPQPSTIDEIHDYEDDDVSAMTISHATVQQCNYCKCKILCVSM